MKKAIALLFAFLTGWILFLPFDVPFFIDEAIALPIFIAAMRVIGFDVLRWLPFLSKLRKKSVIPHSSKPAAGRDTTIDV